MDFDVKDSPTSMDPKLLRLLERRGRGIVTEATSSTSADEVAVVAKVNNIDAWNAHSEVREGVDLGVDEDGYYIVTARIPLTRVEHLRNAPEVSSLKPARRLRTLLHDTINEISAREDLLPHASIGKQGKGVVIGIIDYGCDFAHKNFTNANGTTRLLALWHQDGSSGPGSPFGYGREYPREQINQALQFSNPYVALGYGTNSFTLPKGSHGTHVMDISAGNGNGTAVPGVAPNADLVFVHISNTDIPFDGEGVIGSSFGDSVHLLEAIKYIFDKAGNRPCVINLSLGTNGGPHDGSTLVEQGIDKLVSQAPNRAVVIAASNSFEDGIHASGKVTNQSHVDLNWIIPAQDLTSNELEIWYSGEDQFRLEIILPNGTSLGSLKLGQEGRIRDQQGNTLLFAAHRRHDPNNKDNVIGIFIENTLPIGPWTLRLHGVNVTNGDFHAWIERDDAGQSSFAPPNNNSHTLGSISCGKKSIVVGSYDAHKTSRPISWFSSAGPTRDNRQKPEISAPGHNVLAASSRSINGTVRMSGTSMAAPAVTGVIALMLAEAFALGLNLKIDQIRTIIQSIARKNPPSITSAWDARYGFGRIDANAAILAVRALVVAAPAGA
ncbi:MAG: S8 family peptidase [Acidobacteriota bacterium]